MNRRTPPQPRAARFILNHEPAVNSSALVLNAGFVKRPVYFLVDVRLVIVDEAGLVYACCEALVDPKRSCLQNSQRFRLVRHQWVLCHLVTFTVDYVLDQFMLGECKIWRHRGQPLMVVIEEASCGKFALGFPSPHFRISAKHISRSSGEVPTEVQSVHKC